MSIVTERAVEPSIDPVHRAVYASAGLQRLRIGGRAYPKIFRTVQPFVGWMATSAYRAPISVFGLFELPPIWPEQRVLSERMFVVHGVIGFAMVAFVVAHVGAALHHHYVRRDRILMRMVKG
jgi:hypothetical protein